MCGRFGRVHDSDDLDLFARYYEALSFAKGGGLRILNEIRKREERRIRGDTEGMTIAAEISAAAEANILRRLVRSSHNIKPTTTQPIIVETEGKRVVIPAEWGWRRKFKSMGPDAKPKLMINGKGEEAHVKWPWKYALPTHRCVIPANFFFEWTPDTAQPHCFALKSKAAFGIGGIWEETDNGVAFVLLTTPPNAVCGKIHDRMPLILRREDEAKWTNPETPYQEALNIIGPYPAELMTSWRVSKFLDKENYGPEVIEPYDVAKHGAELVAEKPKKSTRKKAKG